MSNAGLIALGFSVIFVMNALGAALVFFFKKEVSEKVNTIFLGFASGVMTAASVFSLLLPAIEDSSALGTWKFLPAMVGFLAGGGFLVLLDKLIPHIHSGTNEEEGPPVRLAKPLRLFFAVTIHNIPEGLAVGLAFGAAATEGTQAAFLGALALAVGIGIQNFPEGTAIALPMKTATGSRAKAFGLGALSGAVEPLFALVGYFLAAYLAAAQPWLLSFAAGAMVFVVAEDLIPDAKLEAHPHLSAWGMMAGFAVMMALDVAFG